MSLFSHAGAHNYLVIIAIIDDYDAIVLVVKVCIQDTDS